jgi:hypothetical protein
MRGYAKTTASHHHTNTSIILQVLKLSVTNPNFKILTRETYDGVGVQAMQTLGMEYARERDASVFILSADCIYPKDTFKNLLNLEKETHKKVFFIPPFRVTGDIRTDLKDCDYSSRSLVKLGVANLHTKTARHFMDKYETMFIATYGYCPSTFYWKVSDSGFLARTFHMHPIFFSTPPPSFNNMAIDQGSYLLTDFSKNDVYVVTDSDIALNIDLDLDPVRPILPLKTGQHNPDQKYMYSWAKRVTRGVLRELMKHPLYVHSEDLNDEWESIKLESDEFVNKTYGTLLDE